MHTDTTTPTTPTVDETGPSAGRSLLVAGAKAIGLAVASVVAAYLVALGLGADLLVAGPDGTTMEVTSGMVFGMTVLGGSIGVALAWVFGRWAPRPRVTFLATTLVALAAYAAVPFAAAEAVATAVWLNVFHVAVAIPVLWVLGGRLPRERS